jgi:hypothetical protein
MKLRTELIGFNKPAARGARGNQDAFGIVFNDGAGTQGEAGADFYVFQIVFPRSQQ